MTRKLTTVNDLGKRNSIGFIRLVAALLVVLGHSFSIGGFGEDPLITLTKNQVAIGRVPVDVFFCLSGFLILKSFDGRRSIKSFLWARFLRIYPAYWVCIVLTGVMVPLLFGAEPSIRYVLKNFPLIFGGMPNLPGIDAAHGSINGSLWTLPWELKAYLFCAGVGLLGWGRHRWMLVLAFAVTWLMFAVHVVSPNGQNPVSSGWRLFAFFECGMLFYAFREKIAISFNLFLGSLLLMAVALIFGFIYPLGAAGVFYILAPVPLTYATFYLAMRLPFTGVNARQDISYGVYIYGTLLLNIVALKVELAWLPYVLVTYLLTLIFAYLSWFLVEKPSLRLKERIA